MKGSIAETNPSVFGGVDTLGSLFVLFMDGRMDGQMDGGMDGWMDGWMELLFILKSEMCKQILTLFQPLPFLVSDLWAVKGNG